MTKTKARYGVCLVFAVVAGFALRRMQYSRQTDADTNAEG